jgi:hypothetical protein
VRIPADKVTGISFDDSTVSVNLTREAVEKSPAHIESPLSAAA